MMNKQGRPTQGMATEHTELKTISGHRGLDREVQLIFEAGRPGKSGVDLPEPELKHDRLGGLRRRAPIGLPGLSEPEVVRHFVRLSRKNYAIDYRFTFFDRRGLVVQPVMTWRRAVLAERQLADLKAGAMSTDAVRYRLEVRWAQ